MNRISGYCRISGGALRVNNDLVYSGTTDEPAKFLKEIYNDLELQYPKFFKMDLQSKLAFLCVEVLKKNLTAFDTYGPDDIGLMISNSRSSENTDLKFEQSRQDGPAPSPALFVYTLPNIMLGEIAIRNKWTGENLFLVTSEFDPQIISASCNALLDAKCRACISGWIESDEKATDGFLFLGEKGPVTGDQHQLNAETIKHLYKLEYYGKPEARAEKADH